MLIQKDFINKLKDFGLNSYESKIWTALLSRGVSTAGELSDIANVPRSRSYDVLESLEKKGFIIMKIGKPIKYIAVEPGEVIERVKKRLKKEASQKEEILDKIKESDVLTELNLLHNEGVELIEPTDLSGSIKGRDNVYDQLESMMNSAQNSIVLMTSEDGLLRKAKMLRKVLKKNNKTNIKIAVPVTDKTKGIIEEFKNMAEIRNIKDVKARFCVIDGKQLFFMLTDDKKIHPNYDTGIWVNSDFFTSSFMDLFDSVWTRK